MSGVFNLLRLSYHASSQLHTQAFPPASSLPRVNTNHSLMLIANRESIPDGLQFLDTVELSVGDGDTGVSHVQYRDHTSSFREMLRMANSLSTILRRTQTPLIINTPHSIRVAYTAYAQGIYVEHPPAGKTMAELIEDISLLSSYLGDLDPEEGEKYKQSLSIGVPVTTGEDVFAAEKIKKLSYASVKIALSQQTNPREDVVWGLDGLEEVRHLSSLRLVAVGNINEKNAAEVYEILNPDDGIAVAGAILRSENPYLAARRFQEIRQRVLHDKAKRQTA